MTLALFVQLLQDQPVFYISLVVGVVLSIVLHELGHGVAAIWQGDDTPRSTGHMTWDPMVHMGGLSLALLCVVGIAFGAMPVNPSRFRSRYGDLYVAAAGPLTNLVLAFLSLTVLGLWMASAGTYAEGALANVQQFLLILGYMNLVLCLFNLLPIPPLDGATVLGSLWPSYREFVRNPNNQPFVMGGFILAFYMAGHLMTLGSRGAHAYLDLFVRG